MAPAKELILKNVLTNSSLGNKYGGKWPRRPRSTVAQVEGKAEGGRKREMLCSWRRERRENLDELGCLESEDDQ